MRKFLLIFFLTLFSFIILIALGLIFILYMKPDIAFNTKNLDRILERTQILKEWKWDKGEINLTPYDWNTFNLHISFTNFCFTYVHESADIKSCLDKIKIDADIDYDLKDGLKITSKAPLLLVSSFSDIRLKESNTPKEASPPPDVWGIWQMLWGQLVPELDISFSNINLHTKEKSFNFGLNLQKSKNYFKLSSFDFLIEGTPKGIQIQGPESYKLPIENESFPPLHLNKFFLSAPIREKGIAISIKGSLESAPFEISTNLALPLVDDFSSVTFLRKMALETNGSLQLHQIKRTLKTHGRPPYNELPAPINAMDGSIIFNFKTQKTNIFEEVLILGNLKINLESKDQALDLELDVNAPLNLETFKPGQIGLGIKLDKVLIQLPKVSKTSVPPQFLPDSRFKSNKEIQAKKKPAKPAQEIEVRLNAQGENALNLKTDLLDEVLRINFNLEADQKGLKKGYVKILPLKTTVFKRPIQVRDILIKFQETVDPVIDAHIEFPLPEYRIFLELEGPVSKPKYAFRSEPPLPQNDIYAVLLFGRPMADLDPDTQGAAGQTNKILSQGILSLSVLYFLAGSPVEYIGYDPNSKEAQAQIGLGKKTSLRVGAREGGQTSTGIRRSLGKGWYIDTSVQSATSSSNSGNDYGVLLERIIAY